MVVQIELLHFLSIKLLKRREYASQGIQLIVTWNVRLVLMYNVDETTGKLLVSARSLIESPVTNIPTNDIPKHLFNDTLTETYDIKSCDDTGVLPDKAINIIVLVSNSLDPNERPIYPASRSDNIHLPVIQRSECKAAQPHDIQNIF